jgi:hypothetical protein
MCYIRFASEKGLPVSSVRDGEVEDEVRWTNDSIAGRDAHRALPCLHLIDDKVSGMSDFVVAKVIRDEVVIIIIGARANEYSLFPGH